MSEQEEQITNLNKRKSILKGQLTRFETFINNTDIAEDQTQLELRLQKIEIAFEEFNFVQTDLEILECIYWHNLNPEPQNGIMQRKDMVKEHQMVSAIALNGLLIAQGDVSDLNTSISAIK
ncbi:unnamed protein product [Psylliodes chrysocephalus]|uniref:Uncharacterized protein n=1 Tax=Psylliodes chrysocephalus TaxID=3402493 RepID=A0A9P0GE17_9CUCU|nr:unnamed protein product [Psylliodes chrysocephala]